MFSEPRLVDLMSTGLTISQLGSPVPSATEDGDRRQTPDVPREAMMRNWEERDDHIVKRAPSGTNDV